SRPESASTLRLQRPTVLIPLHSLRQWRGCTPPIIWSTPWPPRERSRKKTVRRRATSRTQRVRLEFTALFTWAVWARLNNRCRRICAAGTKLPTFCGRLESRPLNFALLSYRLGKPLLRDDSRPGAAPAI